MKIVWERSVYVGNVPVFCTICGHQSYPIRSKNQLLLAVLYDKQGVVRGEVCRDCVAAGSEGIKARLHERIEALQTKMAELQLVAQEDVETPTLEQEFQVHRGQ
ncbi:hypothetical protein H6G89_04910 [Oscillatoria sp. FACHB-1407]|uniref:hypothetical protein n=1 Tax=Oscillatoria sp. FACHB-1407 TaxID=2692847 RepID=UPI001689286D|nr:hypothetical protein [Oscillatoria sp. FACHB-1407]MBD2460378.1 hypothetical protein [Oscillatoria sp. FACHB-1407]